MAIFVQKFLVGTSWGNICEDDLEPDPDALRKLRIYPDPDVGKTLQFTKRYFVD
jgi:hypothetical protein